MDHRIDNTSAAQLRRHLSWVEIGALHSYLRLGIIIFGGISFQWRTADPTLTGFVEEKRGIPQNYHFSTDHFLIVHSFSFVKTNVFQRKQRFWTLHRSGSRAGIFESPCDFPIADAYCPFYFGMCTIVYILTIHLVHFLEGRYTTKIQLDGYPDPPSTYEIP